MSATDAREPVRLVIWDLDETFWRGTLTEGGITWRPECRDIVMELARRGIVSTICSKNDLAPVKEILQEHGVWDHFVFPSINWEPKGPRIAQLVEDVQLRAPTLMLIDDNPMNLNEARHFVPGLQTEDENFIPKLLDDPRFKGKDDSGLTRLAQYKLLERRKADEAVASAVTGNNFDFLRGSNIRVMFEYDLEKHIDRVVELINRTNQLNFTKRRLPEDPEAARDEARKLLSEFDVQAGLIRVVDNYGDYGLCGFYAVKNRPPRPHLLHFAFSCRILNMGVEHWLYRHLGRPNLRVTGPVLSDVRDDSVPADWITHTEDGAPGGADAAAAKPLNRVVLRGGCDLTAVGHYFSLAAETMTGEYNTTRNSLQIRLDHSHVLRLAAEGVSPPAMTALTRLGYEPADFDSAVFKAGADGVILLSFVIDASLNTFRHKRLGFRIPFWDPADFPGFRADQAPAKEPLRLAREQLNAHYDAEGPIDEATFKANLRTILERVGGTGKVFILGANERWTNPKTGKVVEFRRLASVNRWTREVLGKFPAATFLDLRQFVEREDEIETVQHYHRMVYYRIYKNVLAASLSEPPAALAS